MLVQILKKLKIEILRQSGIELWTFCYSEHNIKKRVYWENLIIPMSSFTLDDDKCVPVPWINNDTVKMCIICNLSYLGILILYLSVTLINVYYV